MPVIMVVFMVLTYEKVKGSANALYEKWVKICMDSLENAKLSTFSKNIKNIIRDFDNLELLDIKKPRVGLVGEILVKFHPTANNNIVDVLEREGAEAVMPEMANFFLYSAVHGIYKKDHKLEGTTNGIEEKDLEEMRKHVKKQYKGKDYIESSGNDTHFDSTYHSNIEYRDYDTVSNKPETNPFE